MTVTEFIAIWQKADLTERSGCQQHFCGLCRLLGHPEPVEADPTGESFTFERGAEKNTGGDGFADVWKKGYFGGEYIAPCEGSLSPSQGSSAPGTPTGQPCEGAYEPSQGAAR